METERKIVHHIKEIGETEFVLNTRTVRSVIYRFTVELNLSHEFNDEDELAGYDWLRSFKDNDWDLSDVKI